jgi:hypothetical protein
MNRSKGYRATKATKPQIDKLRAELAKCHNYEWRKATGILENIAGLLGHSTGPNGSGIVPRSCRFCGYYGHSSDHCERKKAHDKLCDEKIMERMLREDENLIGQHSAYRTPEQLAWQRRTDNILARVALGDQYGMGCLQTDECDRQGRCKKCKEWAMFMAPALDPTPFHFFH